MHTNKRERKNRDVVDSIASTWRDRLEKCFVKSGYVNRRGGPDLKAFVAAYRLRNKTGNTNDARRWINAGLQDSKGDIGFPSYDTMKRLADFFGVSVGYLTGETDYETFDMEKACTYLGISKATGAAIRALTHGKGRLSDRILGEDYAEILSYLLTAPRFKKFIHELQPVFNATWAQQQEKDSSSIDKAVQGIRPEILESAMECMEYSSGEIPENAPEPTDELMAAIAILKEVEERALDREDRLDRLDRDLRAAKYNLFEEYTKMLNEMLCVENVSAWNESRKKEVLTQEELMDLLNIDIP